MFSCVVAFAYLGLLLLVCCSAGFDWSELASMVAWKKAFFTRETANVAKFLGTAACVGDCGPTVRFTSESVMSCVDIWRGMCFCRVGVECSH